MQQVQPQRESCGPPHPRAQSTHTMFSSDASLSEARVPGHSKGLAPHGACFGSLDVLPLALPHWRRHGKVVGTQQVHVE